MRQYFGLAAQQMAFDPDQEPYTPERRELVPDDAFKVSISDDARRRAAGEPSEEAPLPLVLPRKQAAIAAEKAGATAKGISGTWEAGEMKLPSGLTGAYRKSDGGAQIYFNLGKMQGLLYGTDRGVAVNQDSQAMKFKASFNEGKFSFSDLERIPVEYTSKQLVWEGLKTKDGAVSSSMSITFDGPNHIRAKLSTRDQSGAKVELKGEGIRDSVGNIIIGMENGVVYRAVYEDDGEKVRFFNHEVL
jgi:hypothetical protein